MNHGDTHRDICRDTKVYIYIYMLPRLPPLLLGLPNEGTQPGPARKARANPQQLHDGQHQIIREPLAWLVLSGWGFKFREVMD